MSQTSLVIGALFKNQAPYFGYFGVVIMLLQRYLNGRSLPFVH